MHTLYACSSPGFSRAPQTSALWPADQSVVSQSACFVQHSCSHTWGKLCCVKEEVSASLRGILLTGQQVHDSLTCSLHQLCGLVRVCVCVYMRVWACGNQMADTQSSGKTDRVWQIDRRLWWSKSCLLLPQLAAFQRKLWKAVCVQLDSKGRGVCFSFFSVSQVKKKKAL